MIKKRNNEEDEEDWFEEQRESMEEDEDEEDYLEDAGFDQYNNQNQTFNERDNTLKKDKRGLVDTAQNLLGEDNQILESPLISEALQDDNSDFVKSVKNITVK